MHLYGQEENLDRARLFDQLAEALYLFENAKRQMSSSDILSQRSIRMARSDYLSRAARSSPTFHVVQPGESFLGAGMRPDFTLRQIVAAEQPYRPMSTGKRTSALSGKDSKCSRANGIFSGRRDIMMAPDFG